MLFFYFEILDCKSKRRFIKYSANKKTREPTSFNPPKFKEALENPLKIRSIEDREISKTKSKQKSKPKTKKYSAC